MTFISVGILKTNETSDYATYSFGNPPHKVLGNVKIWKSDGRIELLNLTNKKYEKSILPYVYKALTEHYVLNEFPHSTAYHA